MFVGEREIVMSKGWIAEYKDGSVFCEEDCPWNKLPDKRNIARLILKWEDRFWEITGKDNYTVPSVRGYIDSQGSQGIDSRTIGYYDTDSKVILRVSEDTGSMKWEHVPFQAGKGESKWLSFFPVRRTPENGLKRVRSGGVI